MAVQAERRRRTATAILDAAEAAFAAAGGFEAATIEDIAREADVAVATIYDHFGGKRDVYLALAERLVTRNEEYLEHARSAELSGTDAAVAMGRAYAQFHLDHPLAFRLIGLTGIEEERTQALRREIDRRLRGMLADLAAALGRGIAEGDIRDVDPQRAATVMWASINGILALHARGALPRKELKPALDFAVDLALAGLTEPASTGR